MRGEANRRRNGSVLIIVLWILFGLVSLTLYFGHTMAFDLRASDSRVAGTEAELAIEGARRYYTCVLSNLTMPGVVPDPQTYQAAAVPVGDAKFWLIGRTNIGNQPPTTANFGLIDEASKLNLNYATSNMLIALPRMTPDIVASILAWRSTNTSNTGGGAESSTYQSLQPPYLAKNAPFETVDELRLIYTMNMEILYGEDANLNGILDLNENDGEKSPPSDNMDGRLDPGILEYVTVYSREPATGTNNVARFDVTTYTTANESGLLRALTNSTITLQRARQIITQVNSGMGRGTITSPLHFYILSGMTQAEFQEVEPNIRGSRVQGLVNINTASSTVLACILNQTQNSNVVSQLVTYRQANQANPSNLGTVAWVTQALDRQTAIAVGPHITGKSYQFMADVAAVGHNGRGYRRARFVYDISQGTPKILYRKDLTHLGWALGKDVRDQWLAAK